MRVMVREDCVKCLGVEGKSKPASLELSLRIYARLAQLVRAFALQARGHRFESCIVHHVFAKTKVSN